MTSPTWLWPLTATVFLQIVAALLSQCLWVLAPILTEAAGVPAERVGILSSLVSLGSVWFFMSGGPWLARYGSLRMLQIGSAGIAVCLVLSAWPFWPVMMLSALLLGVAYGPTPPASSDILARYAPARHRATLFSIKQAGAPLGGAIVGAILPTLADAVGWQWSLVAAAAFGWVSVMLVQPLRAEVDASRSSARPVSLRVFVNLANVRKPFEAMRLAAALPGLTGASVAFAFIQGNLFTFTVTYLTTELGYALAAAGVAFAVMQIAGMAGRVLMGWLSDRVGSAVRTLKVLAVAATATTFATSLISPEWPWLSVLAVLASTGLASTSWNGVFLAEVARISPPGKVGDATSGAVFFTFLSYTAGPAVFGFLVSLLGTYAPVIAGMAALGLAAGFALRAAERATGAR